MKFRALRRWAKRRSPWLGVAVLGAIACEPVASGAHPDLPLWTRLPSYALQVVYQRHLVAENRRVGEAYERGRPAIDPLHRRVFVGSSDRGLYSVRAEDGFILWRFETAGAVQSEPLYVAEEDAIYFGSNDGALYKLRAADGGLIWRFATNAEVSRQPVKVGERLYFTNANDTVLALDAKTGRRIWSQHRAPALGMEVAGHAGALVKDETVYVAFSAGSVAAYDARDGYERWEPVDLSVEAEQLLGAIPKYLDVDSTPMPAVINGVEAIVVASYEGGVFALEASTGSQMWSNQAALTATDVTVWIEPEHTNADGVRFPRRELVLVSTGTTGMWALELQTGTEVWRRDLPDGGTQRPVPIAGAMLVATTQQGLFLVSPRDGGVIDGLDAGQGFSMPPAAFGQRAFVLSNAGDFVALSLPEPRRPTLPSHDWP